jgi:exopolysaccharide biosynthesis protein
MKIHKLSAALMLAASLFMPTLHTAAADRQIHLNLTQTREISRGVIYTENRRITDDGMLDVFVLHVPLNDPYIQLSVINSAEYGLKETTTRLLAANNAFAGINGDFFGLAGTHSVPLGLEITGGAVSAINSFNDGRNQHATFYLDENGFPFIDFITTRISFINNGAVNIEVDMMNKSVGFEWPVAITRQAMPSTRDIDARVDGIIKIVVDDGTITYISNPGETVYIPENGFIVALPATTFEQHSHLVSVGHEAHLDIQSHLDLNKITAAVSGGARLLENGAFSTEGTVSAGRHPRTAIGFSEDGQTAILMVVDGRSHSIGATHAETAQLMLEYGAHNAMQLDGGGSATMAVAAEPWLNPLTVNTPSDGAQRRIINAVGVTANAPLPSIDYIIELEAAAENTVLMIYSPNRITVWGRDEYRRRVEIPIDEVQILAVGATVFHGYIIPYQERVHILAAYNGIIQEFSFMASHISRLVPSAAAIRVMPGSETPLSFTASSVNGFPLAIDSNAVFYEVFPPELGYVENNTFKSTETGHGYIRAWLNGTTAYIAVDASAVYIPIPGFNAVGLPLTAQVTDGVSGFRIGLTGDGSGRRLFANIRGADGAIRQIPFSQPLDFTDHRYLTTLIPPDIPQPVSLLGITAEFTGQLLPIIFLTALDGIIVPDENAFTDVSQGNTVSDGRFAFTDFFSDFAFRADLEIAVSAENGGITATDPRQWALIEQTIQYAAENNLETVAVYLDSRPADFTQRMEFAVFHGILAQAYLGGVTVAVIHPSSVNGSEALQGVWYITYDMTWRE